MDEEYPYRKRNLEIYRARKAGETFVAIGKRYGISADRISRICGEERFRDEAPELAAQCEGMNFAPAARLWCHGFTIIPPPAPIWVDE